jgi:hypothetical protein
MLRSPFMLRGCVFALVRALPGLGWTLLSSLGSGFFFLYANSRFTAALMSSSLFSSEQSELKT